MNNLCIFCNKKVSLQQYEEDIFDYITNCNQCNFALGWKYNKLIAYTIVIDIDKKFQLVGSIPFNKSFGKENYTRIYHSGSLLFEDKYIEVNPFNLKQIQKLFDKAQKRMAFK